MSPAIEEQPSHDQLATGEDDRTGMKVETLKQAILENLRYVVGKDPEFATDMDYFLAVAYTVRDRILARWLATKKNYLEHDVRVVGYLSAEFLMGPHLANNLLNLGVEDSMRQASKELGLNLDRIIGKESEPGLGNGGLGRLAACYLDSLATLGIPAIGYGIRYQFGMFRQEIQDGWQVELTDHWLRCGNPWEIRRPQESVDVAFGGHTESWTDSQGNFKTRWVHASLVKGIPYDTPILGYGSGVANDLRLWRSEAGESFYFDRFNSGDYDGAVAAKNFAENITKVLYPNDQGIQGKQLRLEQQYFFTTCALQDMIRLHLRAGRRIETFQEKWTIQLNDTHPSIGVAELMRLLMDEHELGWDQAWEITSNTFNYTNHTLLPEALERWPLPLFASLLPRHIEIIYEINSRFLNVVRERFPGDDGKVTRMSIIEEGVEKHVRMAYLACVGSKHINGVAALHTQLLKNDLLRDFHDLWPNKFINVTNGVTPRRWLAVSNPEQASLMTSKIGNGWITNLEQLKQLEKYAEDSAFRADWRKVRHDVKVRLAQYILEDTGFSVDPSSMFDSQVKRIHEYKRQHLNVLYIVTLYDRLKRNPKMTIAPRTFLFGGKAAAGYVMAKLIIKLINSVAEVINHDPEVKNRIKVFFLPNYNVTFGQKVYPAADLSEQISTAGKEASGTGNMKFAMNGALTIGTLDGANVEIRDAVGHENFFLFGLTAPQVASTLNAGYHPRTIYESNPVLRDVLDSIAGGEFSHHDRNLFRPLVDGLLDSDPYLLLADYQSYVDCQDHVSAAFLDQERWAKMSIYNAVRMGRFSSDRAIEEYCRNIWGASSFEAAPGTR
jgi:glycogen phosphorylase